MVSVLSKQILEYLYNLEFCSIFVPTGDKIYDSLINKKFPLIPKPKGNSPKKKEDEEKKTIYSVYLGAIYYQPILNRLIEKFHIDYQPSFYEKSSSILCGFKLDEDGSYIPSTFSIPNFLYVLTDLSQRDSLENIVFLEEEVKKLQKRIEDDLQLSKLKGRLTPDILDEKYSVLHDSLSIFSNDIHYEVKIFKEEIHKEAEEISPAIFGSFYLEDLTMLKNEENAKIDQFLSLKRKKEIEISKDTEELLKALDPKLSSLGKWPCNYQPSLMQQVAIHLSLHQEDIFSVNGPPGTGKTTFVKEVISDLIIQRAEKMTHFHEPNDAFKKVDISFPVDSYGTCFYQLDDSLKGYEILVASNNNTAVENITLELPSAKDVKSDRTRTPLFDIDKEEEIYFTLLADAVNTAKKNWGLISVRLGKKENIRKFLTPLWFDKEKNVTFSTYFNQHPQSFDLEKKEFKKKYQEVMDYRNHLEQVYQDLLNSLHLEKELFRKEENYQLELEKEHELEKELTTLQEKIEQQNELIIKYSTLLADQRKATPFIIRIFPFFFSKHPFIKQKKEWKERIQKEQTLLFDYKAQAIEQEILVNNQKAITLHLHQEIEQDKNVLAEVRQKLKDYQEKDKITLLDKQDLQHLNTKKVQKKAYFTSPTYDTLREELFFRALQLEKSFILNSTFFKTNLGLLVNMLNNASYGEIKRKYYQELIHNLFLLTPVVSTTLASVQRFLKDIPKEKFGYLILDEAGQATPASVLGALYRSKKAIILGDPFQIEPVVNTPKEFYYLLDSKNQLPNLYHLDTLSAQVVADLQNSYGEKRTEDNWIGCPLLVHRRCINPMFEIANKIAYEEKMFLDTPETTRDDFMISNSTWLDIKGEEISKENHYVTNQGEKVIELLHQELTLKQELPSLYIISPFKSVAEEMRKRLKEYFTKEGGWNKKDVQEWIESHCGTIHTFQGKEAEEVILLLGCTKQSDGAIKWASSKPNILNVAATRAKWRLLIIGDASIWKDAPYFSVSYQILNRTKQKEQE